MSRLNEHIHIHASASEVFARLEATASYEEWLPRCFSEIEVNGEGALECTLALPFRGERARLEASRVEAPSLLQFRAAEGGGAFDSLTWVLSPEGPHEVHLLVDATYTPAGGFPGAIFDVLVQRAHRRQALRDALWRLKHVLEGLASPHGETDGT